MRSILILDCAFLRHLLLHYPKAKPQMFDLDSVPLLFKAPDCVIVALVSMSLPYPRSCPAAHPVTLPILFSMR